MSMRDTIRSALPDAVRDVRFLAPLTLAFVGDTVYDLYVRTHLCGTVDAPPHTMHALSAAYVCAAGQAKAAFRILPILSEAELTVYKRGRNAHCGTVPKNARVADYHAATGLEALIGHLYLTNADERLNEIMRIALKGETVDGTGE